MVRFTRENQSCDHGGQAEGEEDAAKKLDAGNEDGHLRGHRQAESGEILTDVRQKSAFGLMGRFFYSGDHRFAWIDIPAAEEIIGAALKAAPPIHGKFRASLDGCPHLLRIVRESA